MRLSLRELLAGSFLTLVELIKYLLSDDQNTAH